MFHTVINVPLEWSTAPDSGLLIKRIVERDLKGEVDRFWKKCYNLGGGEKNRVTGYDTYAKLLTTIGSDIEKVMSPGWNSIRNFHGLWFADGDVLNEMFDHQHQTIDEFCKAIVQKFPVYKAASAVPSSLISAVGFKRLLERRIRHLNGSNREIKVAFVHFSAAKRTSSAWRRAGRNSPCSQKARWRTATSTTTPSARRRISKSTVSCSITAMTRASRTASSTSRICRVRGGVSRRQVHLRESMVKGDLYTKLEWECHDGHTFSRLSLHRPQGGALVPHLLPARALGLRQAREVHALLRAGVVRHPREGGEHRVFLQRRQGHVQEILT